MSRQMDAVLIIARHVTMASVLLPAIHDDEIEWDAIQYEQLSAAQKIAVSWAYAIWRDSFTDNERGYRDPFSDFDVLDDDLKQVILQAFAYRHGFTHTLFKRTKSEFQKLLEELANK